jgi:hypothetical protein
MTKSSGHQRRQQVKRLSFAMTWVAPEPDRALPSTEPYESVYCLFDTDNGVTFYETLQDALAGKRQIERLVDACGPFEVARHELPLIKAAARTIRLLRSLSATTAAPFDPEVRGSLRELEAALRRVFPFQSVRLSDGSEFLVETKTRRQPRK